MTVADGELIVANHWNGTKSVLYRVDAKTGDVLTRADMPTAAKHTSGLAWDGEWLWAVDHACNTLYRLEFTETFTRGTAAVDLKIPTGLRGSSGLAMPVVDGRPFVAISDFVWTTESAVPLPIGSAKTYLAPMERVLECERFLPEVQCAYDNGGYSQGLAWDGEYLYESLNELGTDRIDVLDVDAVTEDSDRGTVTRVGSFEGPGDRIEDIGTDGEKLWTTDEGTFRLYRLDDLTETREQALRER
jgi:hypothetical protein